MNTPALIPLLCTRCQQPIPAAVDEVAWVCATCGQGLLLDEERGLQPLDFHFNTGIAPGAQGKPLWVVEGRVTIQRSTFRGNESAATALFWAEPRKFFIPAYALALDALINFGVAAVKQNPPLNESAERGAFIPITVAPGDVRPLVEFIVTAIEAERKDMLKTLQFDVQLGDAQLWVLA